MNHGRNRLTSLRDEGRSLAAGRPVMVDAVRDWRQRVAEALEQIFGRDSEPARDFSRINFDDDRLIDVVERTIRDRAADEDVDISAVRIPLPSPDHVLRQALHEAVELLTSLLI